SLPPPNPPCAISTQRALHPSVRLEYIDSASFAFHRYSLEIPPCWHSVTFAQEIPTNCDPSPCMRLSRTQTTMVAPTLLTHIVGLLDLALRDEPPTFTASDSARSLRQRFPIQPIPLFAVSRMEDSRIRVR